MTATGESHSGDVGAEAVARVAEQVKERFPAARALVLTGSTARGEATVIRTAEGSRWLSDMEFLVVIKDSANLRKTAAGLRELGALIQRELGREGVRASIELTPAPERYFSSIRPHLFGYELLRHGRQLFGEEDYLSRIPRFSAADIPREDAWRLLSNRMVEWLDVLRQRGTLTAEAEFYPLSKQYLDLVTSLSIFSGHYEATYRERGAASEGLSAWLNDKLPDLLGAGLLEASSIALGFKLHPEEGAYEWVWSDTRTDLRSRLERVGWSWMDERLPSMLIAAWRWELSEISGHCIGNGDDALRALRRVYGWKERLRGWGRPLMLRHLRVGSTFLTRMARLAPVGTPRGLVYACAEQLLESRAGSNRSALPWVKFHLPALFGRTGESWQELSGQCVQNWERFLRMASA